MDILNEMNKGRREQNDKKALKAKGRNGPSKRKKKATSTSRDGNITVKIDQIIRKGD